VEILFELLFELVFELAGEFLFELGGSRLKKARGRPNHHPVAATLGFLLVGGALGWALVWLFPQPFLSSGRLPGLSLVVSPLLAGTAMHFWGEYRRSHGRSTTNLATFYGGATFAFGVALVRVLGTR
jgi:hypothetical protein